MPHIYNFLNRQVFTWGFTVCSEAPRFMIYQLKNKICIRYDDSDKGNGKC